MTPDTSTQAVEAMADRLSPSEHLNTVPRDQLKKLMECKSVPVGDKGCMEWQGEISTSGYGRVYYNGYKYQAHRVAWVSEHGPMPITCDACHICDNRKCVNPHHIVAGSRKANMMDALYKGRLHVQASPNTMPKGDKHGRAKLTSEAVIEIRKSKKSVLELAAIYDVHQETIRRALKGHLWKDVPIIRALAETTNEEK